VEVAHTHTTKNKTSIDDWNSFDTKLETTEENTTTNGMGSVDDLLGFSFSGFNQTFPDFNQTPSNAVPPSSFSLFDDLL